MPAAGSSPSYIGTTKTLPVSFARPRIPFLLGGARGGAGGEAGTGHREAHGPSPGTTEEHAGGDRRDDPDRHEEDQERGHEREPRPTGRRAADVVQSAEDGPRDRAAKAPRRCRGAFCARRLRAALPLGPAGPAPLLPPPRP